MRRQEERGEGGRCERVSGEEKGGEVSERSGEVRNRSPYLNVVLNFPKKSSLGTKVES